MTPPANLAVVKVGGSLYDHPRLGPGLCDFVRTLAADAVVIVPGGGGATDVIRDLQATHRLSEDVAHWLAIQALAPMERFLAELLLPLFVTRCPVKYRFAYVAEFFPIDDANSGALPHSWEVTSDSLAARVAVRLAADRLILLKSTDIPAGTAWPDAAARGWVDGYFPTAVADATFPIEAINFRKRLDEHFPGESGG